jgi:hypothetical protein
MRSKAVIALAVALLAIAAACHKQDKAEKLKALESAYQSGVFSKEEYEAKKLAILGPPAAAAPPVASQPQAPAEATSAPPAAPSSAPHIPAAIPPPGKPAPPAAPNQANTRREDAEPAPTAGCEDGEFRSGGPTGLQERFFPVPIEAVHRAAALALQNLDFNIHMDNKRQMEASRRRHLSSVFLAGGERLILRFSSSKVGGQSGTRVTGETKKSAVGRLAQKSWTSAVLSQIACNLRTGRH